VDEEYFHASNVHGGYMGYYAHNLHFLVAARMMQGRFDDAYRAANKMADAAKPFVEIAPGLIDPFIPTPWFVLLRFHKWDAMLSASAIENPKLPVTRAMWHFGRALAYYGKGDAQRAETERVAYEKLRAALPADAVWINNKAADVLALASEVLLARKSPADAIAHWRKAIEIQDALMYDEPPPWYYPVRESLGAALLKSGDVKGAERVFRDDLERTPRNGRSLAGLEKALEAQGRTADTQWVKAEFQRAWKRAEIPPRVEDY
jgi:tetratricopeptide (TPR) repeat protein